MDTSEPVRRKRQRLPAIHRYFQLYLFALFVNDVYVFSLIYAFLPSYLLDEGYNTTDLSNAFGADGISNTLGLLVLLYINGIPRVIATSLNTKFLLIVVSTAVCALGSALLTAMPYSYPMLIASKALQGLASSVYFAYSFILTNKLYPLEYQAQTAAVVTAGLTVGDSIALVVGGVVYDKAGIRAAYATQLVPNALVLLMMPPLLMWSMQAWASSRLADSGAAPLAPESSRDQACKDSSGSHAEFSGSPQSQQSMLVMLPRRGQSLIMAKHAAAFRKALDDAAAGSSLIEGSWQRPGSTVTAKGPGSITATAKGPGSTIMPAKSLPVYVERGIQEEDGQAWQQQQQQQQQRDEEGGGGLQHSSTYHIFAVDSDVPPVVRLRARTCSSFMIVQRRSSTTNDVQVKPGAAAGAGAAAAAAAAAAQAMNPIAAVWRVIRSWPVLAECLLVFLCQVSRTAMDILMPLLLIDSPTTVISIVFAVEALGSVAFPFLVDIAVQERGWNSRGTTIGLMMGMAVSCATALVAGYAPLCRPVPGLCPAVEGGSVWQNTPYGMAVVMAVFGACQSAAETLIFGHLAEHLEAQEDAADLPGDVAMNVFVLFLITGTTVGGYVAGVPALGVFWQQQLVAGLLAVVAAVAALVINVPFMLRGRTSCEDTYQPAPVAAVASINNDACSK